MELNHIKIGKYAVTKDGRTVFVREIAEKEEIIRGEEISNPDAPEVEGLRVLRIGLHLGEIRGKTAIPDHAAAVCFQASTDI